MSEQRHDSGSLTLTEEDLGVDPDESPLPEATVDAVPSSERSDAKHKKVRRTVLIPDDEIARPSSPPSAAAPASSPLTQPILGQRIIAIGAGLRSPSQPPPARSPSQPPPAVRAPSVPPPARRASIPELTETATAAEDAAISEEEPRTEPRVPSVPVPSFKPKPEDDSWTPYQPLVTNELPAPASRPLVSPLVASPAAPFPSPAADADTASHQQPPSMRRASVQFEAPPAWARPPSDVRSESRSDAFRRPADSRPFYTSSPDLSPDTAPAASSSVVDLATPTPGQPWGPPRDSIVDVAVDFESDVTLFDGVPAAVLDSGPLPQAVPSHARETRIDDMELVAPAPRAYVAEASDLSSSHLELDSPSGELEAAASSLEEVEIDAEPDSDARPSGGDILAADDVADVPHAPPRPPAKNGDKAAPPAPKLPSPNLLSLGNLAPLPLTDAASQRKKGKPWWEDLFNDDFVRTGAKGVKEDYKAEVDFIEDSLGMEKGATILDLACGTGRHAIELSKRGYRMVGFDLSLAMLARAADLAQAEDQRINFVQGDMREMQFEEAFDGVYSWNTSFGYFEEDKNAQVASLVHRALRKGGQFLLDIVNRDYIIQESPTTAWFEGDACICMDEMHIDWITSRMRVKRTIMFDDGRSRELEYSVRLYSLHELGRLLHEAGFRVTEVSGLLSTPGVFFGCQSPRTMILAEKR